MFSSLHTFMIECPPGVTHQQIIDRITKPLIVHINGFCKYIQDSVNKILQSWNYPKEHIYNSIYRYSNLIKFKTCKFNQGEIQ